MKIEDLVGLSEPLKKLIEVVSSGVGELSKSYFIRKNADAKAYEIRTIANAIKDNQDHLNTIGIDGENLSLTSLDSNSLRGEISLENRTQHRTDYREQKRQENIESITQKAAEDLEPETTVSDERINEDWISRFFDYAEDISSYEMQKLWGRILSGEIKKPKSYSLRTLDVLRNLSTEEAEIFIKFGSLAIQTSGSSFLLNFEDEELLRNEFQLKFGERLLLQELGLLTANDLQFDIPKTDSQPRKITLTNNSTVIIHEKSANKPKQEIDVLAFTKIGTELLQLIKEEARIEYLQLLATKLNRDNGSIRYARIVERLPDGRIKHTNITDIPPTEEEKKDRKIKVQATT